MENKHPDHEAKMAKSELVNIAKNAMDLFKIIEEGDELDGWVSSYITISNDHINSVHEKMSYDFQANSTREKGPREYEANACESIRNKLKEQWDKTKG